MSILPYNVKYFFLLIECQTDIGYQNLILSFFLSRFQPKEGIPNLDERSKGRLFILGHKRIT